MSKKNYSNRRDFLSAPFAVSLALWPANSIRWLINSYEKDSKTSKMFADWKKARDWSVKNKVPILLSEFGSRNLKPPLEDRCRHAEAIYSSLGKLDIPNAWWEWDGGFNIFEKGTTKIADCMRKAIDSFATAKQVK